MSNFTEKFLFARIRAKSGLESSVQKIKEMDENWMEFDKEAKLINTGQYPVYDNEDNCLMCKRGDFHYLLSVETASFGTKKKCGGVKENGYEPVDDQRMKYFLMTRK